MFDYDTLDNICETASQKFYLKIEIKIRVCLPNM